MRSEWIWGNIQYPLPQGTVTIRDMSAGVAEAQGTQGVREPVKGHRWREEGSVGAWVT